MVSYFIYPPLLYIDILSKKMYYINALSAARNQGVPTVAVITRHTRGRVRAGAKESPSFRVDLHYDNTDPYAVKVTFHGDPSEPVVWAMAVSLFDDITAKYSTPAAAECVTVTFDMTFNELFIHLLTDGKETVIVLPANEVLDFVTEARHLMTEEAVTAARDDMIQAFEQFLRRQLEQ